MEGVIRRNRVSRYGMITRKRKKMNVQQEMVKKVIIQLVICVLFLSFIVLTKMVNIPVGNTMLSGVKTAISHKTDMNWVYRSMDQIVNFLKERIYPRDSGSIPVSATGEREDMRTGTGAREASGSLQTGIPGQTVSTGPGSTTSGVQGGRTGSEAVLSPRVAGAASAGSSQQSQVQGLSQTDPAAQKQAQGGLQSASQNLDSMMESIREKYAPLMPVQGVITSGYGNRIHPIKKIQEFHRGIDIDAAKGSQIKAAFDGEVSEVSENPTYGKYVKLKTGNEIVTVYAHCAQTQVNAGDKIKKGSVIAKVGETGNSIGAHLHFEVWLNGKSVNPAMLFER